MKLAEIRQLQTNELYAKIYDLKQELLTLRFQQATGQLQNTSAIAKVRKEVAQINTLLTERKKNS